MQKPSKDTFNAQASSSMQVAKINPAGIRNFKELLVPWEKEKAKNFLKSDMAMPYLHGLMNSGLVGKNAVADCIALYPRSIKGLKIGALADWINQFDNEQRVKILTTNDGRFFAKLRDTSVYMPDENGNACHKFIYHDALETWINEMSPHQKTRVLSADYAVGGLAASGFSGIVLDWMSELEPSQRAAIITSPDRGYGGFEKETKDIWLPWFLDLSDAERKKAFYSPYVWYELISIGQSDLVAQWMEQWDNETKTAVLLRNLVNCDNVFEEGQFYTHLIRWIDNLESDQRTLILAGNIEEIDHFMMDDIIRWMKELRPDQRQAILLDDSFNPRSFLDDRHFLLLHKWHYEMSDESQKQFQQKHSLPDRLIKYRPPKQNEDLNPNMH